MMTLEEMWENLKQDPEIKATMEEVEKSYKLFKKIENLIVADLEEKIAEERKKVVQEIREKLKADISIAEDYFAVVKILDQIERGV